jgi:8-oxo-dGTP diphosphatase
MFVLVRHAHAGDKRQWKGPDRERPLSERGRQQAQGLVNSLSALDSPRFLSSPSLRCRQTLEPLAARHARAVETSALLGPDAKAPALDRFLNDAGLEGAVLCTHGETLTRLMRLWRRDASIRFPDELAPAFGSRTGKDVTEKGAAWIIVDSEAGRTLHYLLPVHVGPVLGADHQDMVDRRPSQADHNLGRAM